MVKKIHEITCKPPIAVICDFDALCLFNDRNHIPYLILNWFKQLCSRGVIILISSKDEGLIKTLEWLKENDVPYDTLFMGHSGNKKDKDSMIKRKIYQKEIKDKYEVLFVLEGIANDVKIWRALGLPCLHCSSGI